MTRFLSACLLLGLAAVPRATGTAEGQGEFTTGPLINLSVPDLFADCGSNGAEKEPYIAVNPVDLQNIVVAWIGGRGPGGSKGHGVGVTFDGGDTWETLAIPGLTDCTGGTYEGAVDPWLSFAPNGDLYHAALVFGPKSDEEINVGTSADGGLTWGARTTVAASTLKRTWPDKPSITADPKDPHVAYAVWDGTDSGKRGPALFSRTTDGGATWSEPLEIVSTSTQDHVQASQILVLPDGTLVDVYVFMTRINNSGGGLFTQSLRVLRSTDRGRTWSDPIVASDMLPRPGPDGSLVENPDDTKHLVDDPGFASVAVDPGSGLLYAVWEDARFSGGAYSAIALSMSKDGGLTWSAPIPVNRTPSDVAPLDRQAFLPSVAVASDGTVGVTYYDFRNNTAAAGVPTDYWFVRCLATAKHSAADPANWGGELRLTDASFDLEKLTAPDGLYFLGDYQGLAAADQDFVAVFTQPHDTDIKSVFFRRLFH